MKQKVTVFGSFVVDLMARTPHLPAPAETVKGSFFKQGAGGKGFNQGVAAHKAGGDVAMITKLGRDSMANVALDVMTELNMPKDFLFYNDDVATGIALIMVDENSSQNEIVIVPGACGKGVTDASPAGDAAGQKIGEKLEAIQPQLDQQKYQRCQLGGFPRLLGCLFGSNFNFTAIQIINSCFFLVFFLEKRNTARGKCQGGEI